MLKFVMLSILLLSTTLAFPNGAGGCEEGPAVGGPHLTNLNVINTTLTETGLDVTFNTVVLDPTLNSISIENGEVFYDIMIVNSPDTATPVEFRGYLIRAALDGGTKGILLDPGMNGQVASACTGTVKGITHIDNSPKTTAGALFGSPTEGGSLTLDVTVVFSNNANEGSRYAHQQYILTVVAELPTIPTVPIEVITEEPSATPSVGPSSALQPSPKPTMTPSLDPIVFVPPSFPPTFNISPPTSAPVASLTPTVVSMTRPTSGLTPESTTRPSRVVSPTLSSLAPTRQGSTPPVLTKQPTSEPLQDIKIEQSGSGLETGAIVAIAVVAGVVIIVIAVLAFLFAKQKQNPQARTSTAVPHTDLVQAEPDLVAAEPVNALPDPPASPHQPSGTVQLNPDEVLVDAGEILPDYKDQARSVQGIGQDPIAAVETNPPSLLGNVK